MASEQQWRVGLFPNFKPGPFINCNQLGDNLRDILNDPVNRVSGYKFNSKNIIHNIS